jgi:hypothetical protein
MTESVSSSAHHIAMPGEFFGSLGRVPYLTAPADYAKPAIMESSREE